MKNFVPIKNADLNNLECAVCKKPITGGFYCKPTYGEKLPYSNKYIVYCAQCTYSLKPFYKGNLPIFSEA